MGAKSTRETDLGVRELAPAFPSATQGCQRRAEISLGRKAAASRRTPKARRAEAWALQDSPYKIVWRTMREPGWMPKPLPPRGTPLGKTPLPLEGNGAGPVAPPPATAIGGAPNDTGAEGSEPMY